MASAQLEALLLMVDSIWNLFICFHVIICGVEEVVGDDWRS